MRALFEDTTGYGSAYSSIVVRKVNLPQNTNRRDIWVRFVKFSDVLIVCTVYKARDDAKAGLTTNNIASGVITMSGSSQTVTLTDNASTSPNMAGLTIYGVFASCPAAGYVVWGYTAAPDLVTCDNIVTTLQSYRGSGKALEEIGNDALIFVADEREAYATPAISVRSVPADIVLSSDAGSLMGYRVPIEVHVAIQSLQDTGDAWRRCRELHAQVVSILHDEARRSLGECHYLYYDGAQGPGMVPGTTGLYVGVVRLMAEYTRVFRDDQ